MENRKKTTSLGWRDKVRMSADLRRFVGQWAV